MAGTRSAELKASTAAILLTLSVVTCSAPRSRDGGQALSPTQTRPAPSRSISPSDESPTPSPQRELDGRRPVLVGESIDVATLEGKVVFDDFEDVYLMRADGTGVRAVTDHPGPEFDGAWAPDGRRIVYRDSRRGINENDEIYITNAAGSGARNLTKNPANDWGPLWSPDGRTIVFNSDRDGGPLKGYLMSPDGSNLRPIPTDAFVEYPDWSPDGRRIVFMGQDAVTSDYDIYVVNVDGTGLVRLTDTTGDDGWPVWSPDGSMIAFASERDDCVHTGQDARCWVTGDTGEHHDIWLMDATGANQRRVTPEFGQFVAWSPDGQYLLVSGYSLYVLRPDGTGRADVRNATGGLPDWIA